MSTLSTDVNTYQQLSTKALCSNNSNMQPTTKCLGNENQVNTVNRHQHKATATQQSQQLSEKINPLLSSMSTMSTDVNSCQQLSTKGLYGNFSHIRHTQVVLALKTMSTLSTDINTQQQLCNTVNCILRK